VPSETPSAVAALETWFLAHEKELRSGGSIATFKSLREGTGIVDIETATHIYQLVAWDNAWCLDVQVIDLESGKSSFPTVGQCEPAVFEEKLNEFAQSLGLAAGNAAT
jgi:hypothetical protein